MKYYQLRKGANNNGNNFEQIPKQIAIEREPIFIRAPASKQAQFEKKIKVVTGCSGPTKIDAIEMNILSEFQAGDPIVFKGKARRVVYLNWHEHLEIELHRLPGVFIYVCMMSDGFEVEQKILK